MRQGIGLGVGINRSNYAQGIFGAYQSRVVADGGVTEAGACVDAVSGLLQTASLLLIPSGYKANKLYSEIPTNGNGDLTWTRTSTAIRTNSSGLLESMATGVPRLSYMYGSCPSALLEPQRTNLALYSSAVGGTGWSIFPAGTGVSATVTTNYAIAPDGNTTASRLQLSLGGGTSTSDQSLVIQLLTGTSCRGSFYIKTNDGSTKTIYVRGSSASNIVIDGTWKRYDFDAGTLSSTQFGIGLRGGQTPTNSNTADILVWGAQLEAGAYATTYIPTTSATATRVADSFSRNNIYTNGLISASGGTWFVELRNNIVYTRDNSATGLFIDSSSSSYTNGFNIRNDGGATRVKIAKYVAGSGAFIYTTTTDTVKIAIKWNGSTADVFANGTKVVSATSFTVTNMEFLSMFNGYIPTFIQQMALFPTPLSDTDCATLTT